MQDGRRGNQMPRKSKRPEALRTPSDRQNHALWCVAGIGVASAFTGVGVVIAAATKSGVLFFLQEWVRLQGFFLIALGTWLCLIVRSRSFDARVKKLLVREAPNSGPFGNPIFRFVLVSLVCIVGTTSLIRMGFGSRGPVLVFMWITCALVCLASGIVTLHALEILAVLHNLRAQEIKVFRYAPARTPELRSVVGYFSSFGLLMSLGYAFALVATFTAHWTGPSNYVEVVRLFWPVVYVPTCSIALVYPHLVVHQMIKREKERTLASCQQDIDQLLSKYSELKTEDIDRTNTLAQLFDRIIATPDYVIDVGIAARTMLPLVLNLLTLLAKFAFR